MAITTKADDCQEESRDDVTRRGLAIYEERLKDELEREHPGKVVAIHPDNGDYVIADNSPDAMRALIERHPEGQMFIRRIGPPTPGDLRLATRIVAAEVVYGR